MHFPTDFFRGFEDLSKAEIVDALHGAGNVLKTIGTLLLLSDPRDLALAVLDDSEKMKTAFEPDLVLYDTYPGGIGQSDPLFRRRTELIKGALELARGCACEAGCPSCVGPSNEIGQRGKEAAIRILEKIAAHS
jgi:DEAD/DEAH box helicase domain-containing protein